MWRFSQNFGMWIWAPLEINSSNAHQVLSHPVEDYPLDCQQPGLMWRFFPLLWSPT